MVKNLLLFSSMILLAQFAMAQCGNLYIGGIIDGPLSGGTPKAIQFCATADIGDLSIYGFGSANNGGGTDGQEFTFPAEAVNSGECFWVASESSQFNNFFGFTPCYTSGAASINGDDAIELFCNSSVTDLFGDINQDGTGECWDHLDGWAVNNSGGPNNGAFSCTDWTFSGTNALDGENSNATAGTPYPSPAQTCPTVPLPINLSSFEAKMMSNSEVAISWTTASEENNDYFSVEHSTDGRTFTEIGQIYGAGTTVQTQEYEFMHKGALAGTNYYRLLQVDFNGDATYSPIKVVVMEAIKEVSLRPTLADATVTVAFGDTNTPNTTLEVLSLQGQILDTHLVGAGTNQLEISVADLTAGMYLIRMTAGQQTELLRFVKR